MSEQMIVVDDLRHMYRKGKRQKYALDGLSFSVARGEVFGLLGPNGAGKTTTIRILTTLLQPLSGRVLIAGHDVVAHPLEARRRLAAVLQESAVETLLTVWDNLLLYGYLHGCSRKEVERKAAPLIAMLELESYLKERAHGLSGGYKRRLQVAKALMVETPILFLDEATTGMDPLVKRRVIAALREQVAGGRTVVLTTQLLDEAEALCDRMVLLHEGRALAAGNLAELRALSRRMFRIQVSFTDANGEAVAALRELAPHSLEERDGEIEMVVEGSEDEWIRHMARISERWPLAHLDMRGANLEQIFVELYGAKAASEEAR